MPPIDVTSRPLPRLGARSPDSHKGDYGRVLLVGGSRGMSGAIALAGLGALRSGAGLVTLAVPRSIQEVAAAYHPALMSRGLADESGQFTAAAADQVLAVAKEMDVVAVGPGLGRSQRLTDLVVWLYREVERPMVVDADALFALAERPATLANPGGPRLLTPHPGEFARLTGQRLDADDSTRCQAAGQLARGALPPPPGGGQPDEPAVVVLKGHHTVVTDGAQHSFNKTGNPGMASGGTGDVLSGIVAALVAQGLAPFDAARLGAHVHGLAGDLAAERLGEISLIASDLVDFLPAAFQATAATT